ncbi:MAG: hypothetical protein NVSMB49_08740 [Ktedonobacteraceae bacterium]
MRKTSPKQGHERRLERLHAFKEIGERPLSTDGVPSQESEKIDRFIVSEASPSQTDLLGKGFQKAFRREVTSNDDDFSKPYRDRGTFYGRCLDFNTRVGYHRETSFGKMTHFFPN